MKKTITAFLVAGCMAMLIPLMAYGIGTRRSETKYETDVWAETGTGITAHDNNGNVTEIINMPEKYRLLDIATGEMLEISADEYLLGAVAAEAKKDDSEEFLKVMGIVINTCGLKSTEKTKIEDRTDENDVDFLIDSETGEGYMTEDKAKEKFGEDWEQLKRKIKNAAEFAGRYAIFYNGEIAVSVYHERSAGKTESSENIWGEAREYLVPVVSVGDMLSTDAITTKVFSKSELREMLAANGIECGEDISFGNAERSNSGYVLSIEIGGKKVSGTALSIALGLPSSSFEISESMSGYTFLVKGEGHGVGLSKNGARFLVESGFDCFESIEWYYPGTTVREVGVRQ